MDSGPVSGTGQALRRNDKDLTDALPERDDDFCGE
jgi:hypothetical protein